MFLVLMLYLINVINAGNLLEPGFPFENWKLECDKTQALGGFRTFLVNNFEKGTDIKFFAFCRSLRLRSAPKVKIDNRNGCRETEPFILGVTQFSWRDKRANCKSGEFVNGLVSEWLNEKHYRKVKLICCKPLNAKTKSIIPCSSVGPSQIMQKRLVFMKSPYEPVFRCPNEVLTGFEYTQEGLALKFCPLTVQRGQYNNRKCADRKVTDVQHGELITRDDLLIGLTEVEPNSWTDQDDDWQINCGNFQAVNSIAVKYLGQGNIVLRVACEVQFTDPQTAFAVRHTRWAKLTEEHVGCRKGEVLQGIMSKYEEEERFISLICASNSNSNSGNSRLKTLTMNDDTEQVLNSDNGFFQSVFFGLKNVSSSKLAMTSLITTYEYASTAKFQESTIVDEISGVIEIVGGKEDEENLDDDDGSISGTFGEISLPEGADAGEYDYSTEEAEPPIVSDEDEDTWDSPDDFPPT